MRSLPFFVAAVASTVVITSSVSADSVSRVQARAGTSAAPLGAPSWLVPAPGMGRTLPPTVGTGRTLSRMRRHAATKRYVIRDLGVPAGLQDPLPFAINQEGDVALQICPSGGCTSGRTGTWYPYLYDFRAGRLLPLARFGTYKGEFYFPQGLNDRGQIVGFVYLYDGTNLSTRPVEWKRVGPTGSTIAFLDATGSSGQAFAINENGRAVGGDGGYPVRFERTAPVPIGPGPNYGDTAALAVNENGLAVGEILAGPIRIQQPEWNVHQLATAPGRPV